MTWLVIASRLRLATRLSHLPTRQSARPRGYQPLSSCDGAGQEEEEEKEEEEENLVVTGGIGAGGERRALERKGHLECESRSVAA